MADFTQEFSQTPDKPRDVEPNRSILEGGIHNLVGLVMGDSPNNTRDEIEHYTAAAIKAAPMFVPKRSALGFLASYAGSALLNGADQAQQNADPGTQLQDFELGAAKGLLMQTAFDKFNATKLNWAAKGFGTGLSMRAAETGLSRENLLNSDGHVDLSKTASAISTSMFNESALTGDLLVLGMGSAVGRFVGPGRSITASTMMVAGATGFTSGAMGEVYSQNRAAGADGLSPFSIDWNTVMRKGTFEGLAMGAGSLAGMKIQDTAPRAIDSIRTKLDETMSANGAVSSTARMLKDGFSSILDVSSAPNPFGPQLALAGNYMPARERPLMMSLDAQVSGGRSHDRIEPSGSRSARAESKSLERGTPLKAFLENEGMSEFIDGLKGTSFWGLRAVKMLAPPGDESAGIIQLAPDGHRLPEGGVLKLMINPHGGEFHSDWGKRPFDSKPLMHPEEFEIDGNIRAVGYVQRIAKVRDTWPVDDVNAFVEKMHRAGYEWLDSGGNAARQIGETSEGLVLLDYSAAGRKADRDPTFDALVEAEQAQHKLEAKSNRDQVRDERKEEKRLLAEEFPTIVDSVAERTKQSTLLSTEWNKVDPRLGVAPAYVVEQSQLSISTKEIAEELVVMQMAAGKVETSKFDSAVKAMMPQLKAILDKAKRNGLN